MERNKPSAAVNFWSRYSTATWILVTIAVVATLAGWLLLRASPARQSASPSPCAVSEDSCAADLANSPTHPALAKAFENSLGAGDDALVRCAFAGERDKACNFRASNFNWTENYRTILTKVALNNCEANADSCKKTIDASGPAAGDSSAENGRSSKQATIDPKFCMKNDSQCAQLALSFLRSKPTSVTSFALDATGRVTEHEEKLVECAFLGKACESFQDHGWKPADRPFLAEFAHGQNPCAKDANSCARYLKQNLSTPTNQQSLALAFLTSLAAGGSKELAKVAQQGCAANSVACDSATGKGRPSESRFDASTVQRLCEKNLSQCIRFTFANTSADALPAAARKFIVKVVSPDHEPRKADLLNCVVSGFACDIVPVTGWGAKDRSFLSRFAPAPANGEGAASPVVPDAGGSMYVKLLGVWTVATMLLVVFAFGMEIFARPGVRRAGNLERERTPESDWASRAFPRHSGSSASNDQHADGNYSLTPPAQIDGANPDNSEMPAGAQTARTHAVASPLFVRREELSLLVQQLNDLHQELAELRRQQEQDRKRQQEDRSRFEEFCARIEKQRKMAEKYRADVSQEPGAATESPVRPSAHESVSGAFSRGALALDSKIFGDALQRLEATPRPGLDGVQANVRRAYLSVLAALEAIPEGTQASYHDMLYSLFTQTAGPGYTLLLPEIGSTSRPAEQSIVKRAGEGNSVAEMLTPGLRLDGEPPQVILPARVVVR